MADIREKIQKLLALSKSPNEHEAYAALVKARELIAKNKLDERDFKDKEKKKVIKTIEITGVSYSMRRNPWMNDLKEVIAKNYCCKSFAKRIKKTRYIKFMGLEEDVDMCTDVFWYALNCINDGIEKEKKKYKGAKTKDLTIIANSYGFGFVDGLKQAFEKQNQENEKGWGLVLQCPKEVIDKVNEICGKPKNISCKAANEIHPDTYSAGYVEGKQFTTRKKLGEENGKIES